MIAILGLGLLLAQEAWEPVIFGGLIPFLGLLALGLIIYRAARDTDDEDE